MNKEEVITIKEFKDMEANFPMLSNSFNEKISELKKELYDTYTKKQIFRTETEMRLSVLNDYKHPTPAAKYWQCVKEQSGMFENLMTLSFEYRRNEIELLKSEKKIEETEDEFARMELEVDRDECLYKRSQFEQTGKDRARELEHWSRIKKELDNGSFDTKNPNTHQMESLPLRFQNQIKSMTPSTPASEAQNIIGLYKTAERHLGTENFEKLKNRKTIKIGKIQKSIKDIYLKPE